MEELEPIAARVPELEQSLGEIHGEFRELLAQRRVRLGLALARPVDFLRQLLRR